MKKILSGILSVILFLIGWATFWGGVFFWVNIVNGTLTVRQDLESAVFFVFAMIALGTVAALSLIITSVCEVAKLVKGCKPLTAVQDGRSVYVRQGKKTVATATLDNEDPLSEEELNSILELVRKHREAKS